MNKKNYLWNMLTMMMVAMLSVAFVSCSSDDDDKENGNNGGDTTTWTIVGTWEMTQIQGYYEDKETGNKLTFDATPGSINFEEIDVADYVRYEFRSDNIMKGYEWENNTWSHYTTVPYRYNATNKTLTMAPGVEDEEEVLKVTPISSTEMFIESTEEDEYEKLYIKSKFKKV